MRTRITPDTDTFHAVTAAAATTLTDGSKKKSSTEFRWTDDEVALLLKCFADFQSQKEYQGTNWEDTRNKYEKMKKSFID